MPYKRGDVVLVPFPFSDTETTKKRPAVIVQSNSFNRKLDTVIVAQITSNISRANKEPSQLLVKIGTPEGRLTGLLHDSAVKCETLATISKNKLLRTIGKLTGPLPEMLDASLRKTLDV